MTILFGIVRRSFSKFVSFKPRPIVISGPSGSGKSTLIKLLFNHYPTTFAFSCSHTTRKPRPGEENGRDYYFVSRAIMEKMIADGEFLETTEFSSNLYGTSKRAVDDISKTGRICILDVDKQGVKNIRQTNLKPLFIFINAPNFSILEQRLRSRNTDTAISIEKRLVEAKESIEFSQQPGIYDHIIINDQLSIAYQRFQEILRSDIEAVLEQQKKS